MIVLCEICGKIIETEHDTFWMFSSPGTGKFYHVDCFDVIKGEE